MGKSASMCLFVINWKLKPNFAAENIKTKYKRHL